jgi:benzoate membrane transport protein
LQLSVLTSAIVAALVGFGGTLAIVVAALKATGANPVQIASGVTAICIAIAGASAYLSWRHKMPIIAAWSTPGAVLIAASAIPVGMEAATGAFLLAAGLVLLTTAVKPLGDLVSRIPPGIAAAMLAGIMLRLVLVVFETAQTSPALVLPLLVLFLVARLVSPAGGMLVVVAAGIALAFALKLVGPLPPDIVHLSTLTLITPRFDPVVLIGLGLPLYLVTMASQNLPGFAVLRASGYEPPARPILAVTGLGSLLTAPLGALTTNLAAISAAICTGPDTHADVDKRWPTDLFYGAIYLIFAAFGASLVALFAALPGEVVRSIAGLALLGPLVGALGGAMADLKTRLPAVLTLVVTASGVSAFSIGSAFWGLCAGLAALALERGMTVLRNR